ncbi:MAG TPA: VanZ family protein, partial [Fimbriimonas sp.]|nr:VanZ family protein [Fimbriimonas sp.]
MQKLAGLALPAIVLVLLYIFPEHRSQFVYPIIAFGFSALIFAIIEPKLRRPDLLTFWFGLLSVAWLISERREAREVSPIAIPVFLAIFGLTTAFLLSGKRLSKTHAPLIFAFLLTACVTFLSGSSGGSDKMESPLNFLGLSREQLLELIHWLRRLIHVTFYASLTLSFAFWLAREGTRGKRLFWLTPLLPLACAICDEFRQSLM